MNRSQSDSKTQPIDPGQTPGVMAEMGWDWFCREPSPDVCSVDPHGWCWVGWEWVPQICPCCQRQVWADHRPWHLPWLYWPAPCYSFDEACESLGRWKREECAG